MSNGLKNVKPNSIGNLIKSRRTINFYQQKSISVSILIEAIEIARWAPNHKKTEPWHFYLLGEEVREKVIRLIVNIKSAGKNDSARDLIKKRLVDIPGWFILTSNTSGNKIVQRENYAACCCAAQNIMLYLWDNGIGSKWSTGEVTRDKRLYELLNINKEESKVVGLFWYGYPEIVPTQTRIPTKEIFTKLR